MEKAEEFLKNHKIEFDLHTHSTVSDGTLSPYEIIDLAYDAGLQGVAITDHDNICSEDIASYAQKKNITLIQGIEFSTDIVNLHIIGYNLNINCKVLQDYINNQKLERERALREMCERTEKYNVPVAYEELQRYTSNKTIGRPHLAAIMVEKGYVKNIYQAFHKYLRYDRPVFVDYKKYNFKRILNIILECNGTPVLAHPGMLYKNTFKKIIFDAVKNGLKGIEIYYPRHSYKQTYEFYKLAKENNLLITGGSDFHGIIKPDIKLGAAGINKSEFEEFYNVIS